MAHQVLEPLVAEDLLRGEPGHGGDPGDPLGLVEGGDPDPRALQGEETQLLGDDGPDPVEQRLARLGPDLPEAIGLGARDSLRIEAGLPLYGQDMDEDPDPVTAGLVWAVPKPIT